MKQKQKRDDSFGKKEVVQMKYIQVRKRTEPVSKRACPLSIKSFRFVPLEGVEKGLVTYAKIFSDSVGLAYCFQCGEKE